MWPLNLFRNDESLSQGITPAVDLYVQLQMEYEKSVMRKYGRDQKNHLLIQHAIAGSIKLYDALALRTYIFRARPKKILEIGSYLGFSTRWLLEACAGWDGNVTSLDPRIRHRIFDDLESHVAEFCRPHESRFQMINAFFSSRNVDDYLFDYLNSEPKISAEVARMKIASIPVIEELPEKYDLIFIDGDHRYHSTADNLLLALTMLNEGGSCILHDALSWPEVVPAVKDVTKNFKTVSYIGCSGGEIRKFFSRWWSLLGMDKGSEGKMTGSICDGLAFITSAKLDQTALNKLNSLREKMTKMDARLVLNQ